MKQGAIRGPAPSSTARPAPMALPAPGRRRGALLEGAACVRFADPAERRVPGTAWGRVPCRVLIILCALAFPCTPARGAGPAELARSFSSAVEKVNQAHAQRPGKTKEPDLWRKLPRGALQALESLLSLKAGPGLEEALVAAGEAALDLDLAPRFQRIRARLEAVAPKGAAQLGIIVSRSRFIVRGLGGLEGPYLERFADTLDGILDAYQAVFGFAEWSKVPGKKLRVRVHLEEAITRPPHFAPERPFHSEVDFPVVDKAALRSPTPDGKFLLYGLCHELGHVIAMWGDPRQEEDHHAWAHYTGVVIVESLSKGPDPKGLFKELRDVRWRSATLERQRLSETSPSTSGRDGVLALLLGIEDAVGTKAMGDAFNRLEAGGKLRRVQRVRYASFSAFRGALEEGATADGRRALARVFSAAAGQEAR